MAGLNRDRVRRLVRHALGERTDASVRVYVFESDGEPATMVTVKEPAELATPQRELNWLSVPKACRRGESAELKRQVSGSAGRLAVAARWLRRYLEKHPETTIDEAALAASCLAALRGYGAADTAQGLRAMAARATRWRRGRGVD